MRFIQVLIVGFAVYALTRTFIRFRNRSISGPECILWGSFWLAVGVLVLDPDLTQRVADLLGVGRGADAVFYLAIVGLSYAFFRLYLRLRHQDQQLTILVRKLALQHPEVPGPKSNSPSEAAPKSP